LTTFTPQDDILVKLNDRFLAFDRHGNQLAVEIEDRIINDHLLQRFKVFQTQKVVRPVEGEYLDQLVPNYGGSGN
jgi:hypothetical protein